MQPRQIQGTIMVMRNHPVVNAAHQAERQKVAGSAILPQLVLVSIPNLRQAIRELGPPAMTSEPGGHLGALQWWPVKIAAGDLRADGFVIRHENAGVGFLEVASPTSFESIRHGTPVALAFDGAEPVVVSLPRGRPAPWTRQNPVGPVVVGGGPFKPPRVAPRRLARDPRPIIRPPMPAMRPVRAPAPVIIKPVFNFPPDGQRKFALILGGGSTVWVDVKRLEQMIGHPWDGLVIAINDIGCYWPRKLDHWVTLHAEKLGKWRKLRRDNGHPDGYETWSKAGTTNADHALALWASGGSSGLLAIEAACVLGCHSILAGVPMDRSSHFTESAEHRTGTPWQTADIHWKAWTGPDVLAVLKQRVRSMSGRTMQVLGAPTLDWLQPQEPAQNIPA